MSGCQACTQATNTLTQSLVLGGVSGCEAGAFPQISVLRHMIIKSEAMLHCLCSAIETSVDLDFSFCVCSLDESLTGEEYYCSHSREVIAPSGQFYRDPITTTMDPCLL